MDAALSRPAALPNAFGSPLYERNRTCSYRCASPRSAGSWGERPVPHGDEHGRERDGVVLGNDDVEPVVKRGSMDKTGERRLLRAHGCGEAGHRQSEYLHPCKSNARPHEHAREFSMWSALTEAAMMRRRDSSGQQSQTRRRSNHPARSNGFDAVIPGTMRTFSIPTKTKTLQNTSSSWTATNSAHSGMLGSPRFAATLTHNGRRI